MNMLLEIYRIQIIYVIIDKNVAITHHMAVVG